MSKHKIFNGLCSLIITRPNKKEETADEPADRKIYIIDGQTVIRKKETRTITIVPGDTMVQILKEEEKGG